MGATTTPCVPRWSASPGSRGRPGSPTSRCPTHPRETSMPSQRSSSGSSMPSPPSISRPTGSSTSVASRRAHQRLLSRARRHQPARRASHHHLDTALPARPCTGLPRQPADASTAVSGRTSGSRHRTSRKAPRPWSRTCARQERPDAPRPLHPRGHPGSLPPAGRLESLPVTGTDDLHQRPLRRGLGRVHHAGHGRPRLRLRRPGLRADPLEALPAGGRERHPRCHGPTRAP